MIRKRSLPILVDEERERRARFAVRRIAQRVKGEGALAAAADAGDPPTRSVAAGQVAAEGDDVRVMREVAIFLTLLDRRAIGEILLVERFAVLSQPGSQRTPGGSEIVEQRQNFGEPFGSRHFRAARTGHCPDRQPVGREDPGDDCGDDCNQPDQPGR